MIAVMCAASGQTFSAERDAGTPDPVTKLVVPGTAVVASNCHCFYEPLGSMRAHLPIGKGAQPRYLLTWPLTGNPLAPVLAEGDLVTLPDGNKYEVTDLVDDTHRPTDPYMTCKLKFRQ